MVKSIMECTHILHTQYQAMCTNGADLEAITNLNTKFLYAHSPFTHCVCRLNLLWIFRLNHKGLSTLHISQCYHGESIHGQ